MTFAKGQRFVFGPSQPAANPPMPPLMQQAKNFTRAVVRNVSRMARGNAASVSPEVAAERIAICQKCELFNAKSERCSHPKCACFLRLKTWLKAESCPAGKWGLS